jgi:hypothetical protein
MDHGSLLLIAESVVRVILGLPFLSTGLSKD